MGEYELGDQAIDLLPFTYTGKLELNNGDNSNEYNDCDDLGLNDFWSHTLVD